MTEKVIVELPEDLAQQVRSVAAHTQRSFAEVLVDWIRRAGAEPVLELLPDEELLAVCDGQMDPGQEEELSELLGRNQEGALLGPERARLDARRKLPAVATHPHESRAEPGGGEG